MYQRKFDNKNLSTSYLRRNKNQIKLKLKTVAANLEHSKWGKRRKIHITHSSGEIENTLLM